MPDANELRRQRHEKAKQFDCSRCGASPGQPCQRVDPPNAHTIYQTVSGRLRSRFATPGRLSSTPNFTVGSGQEPMGGLHKERWAAYEDRSVVDRLAELLEKRQR
jgi:hypothetical protein